MRDRAKFLAAFVRRPFSTGSITPSSAQLAAAMVEGMGLPEANTVLEVGPGTGVFTRVIEKQLRPGARLLCFEINREMADQLQERFPRAHVVNDSVENLGAYLQANDSGSVDTAISGLPWAAFAQDHQEKLLDATVGALRPGGHFATFAYSYASWLPAGRRFRALLTARFSRIEVSPVVWQNLPPAFVYRCRK